MSYEILSVRLGNPAGDAVVLQTADAGEVHLDLTKAADHPHVNNRAARAAYEAWRAMGNAPAAFQAPTPPTKADRIRAAFDSANDLQRARIKREAVAAGKTVAEYLAGLAAEL